MQHEKSLLNQGYAFAPVSPRYKEPSNGADCLLYSPTSEKQEFRDEK